MFSNFFFFFTKILPFVR